MSKANVGDQVRAEVAMGDGWAEVIEGEIVKEAPLPPNKDSEYDKCWFVDDGNETRPVRKENVTLIE